MCHRVEAPGGIAGALLTSMGSFIPGGQLEFHMLQAAIMTMAPNKCLGRCKSSSSCCWRWAAEQLLMEYTTVRAEANSIRLVLVEEVGDSAKQRMLQLQEVHNETVANLEAANKELESLRRTIVELEARSEFLAAALSKCEKEKEELRVLCEEAERGRIAYEVRAAATITELKEKVTALDFQKDNNEDVIRLTNQIEIIQRKGQDDAEQAIVRYTKVVQDRDALSIRLLHWETTLKRGRQRRLKGLKSNATALTASLKK